MSIALAAATAPAALAADASGGLRAMCFAPAELAARPQEQHPVKGQHAYDKPAPARQLAPYAPLAPELRGAIRRVTLPPGSPKLVALTFDLCEQPGEIAGYDGAIVDYLRANNIKATLFAGGKWLRSHTERARQLMSDPLFELGNHTEAHRNLRALQGQALSEEIAGPQRAYETVRSDLVRSQCVAQHARLASAVPARLTTFRFPYGACNAQAMQAVNDAGLAAIQWDNVTGDPSPAVSAQAIAEAIVHRTKPGSIVVMHANGRGHHTAEALPMALPKLIQKGYRFVTVSELLAAGRPEIAPSCYNVKLGDTEKYDFLAQRPPARNSATKSSSAPK